MAKRTSQFVCQSCGAVTPKWSGRCESCGAWNTVIEEPAASAAPGGLGAAARGGKAGRKLEFQALDGPAERLPRRTTGIAELDRVCGSGLVAGSAVLIGGDPGIGKSTLLLQAAAGLAGRSGLAGRPGQADAAANAKKAGATAGVETPCLYISGEESVDQVRLRAHRLGLSDAKVRLASATSVRDIAASLDEVAGAGVVIADSIQTLYVDNLDSAPGTVAQVRASAQELIRLAKTRGFTLFLVGHVTKEGVLAGPRVLEHMVDTVLYFEGERGHQFRILRAVKNRFGPTDEIGVFEMTDAGLVEVANPSALFLAERRGDASGVTVFAGIEGTRPLLVEIQALVSASPLATPRRAVVGWDSARLAMVLAVLEARCGLILAGKDIYLNVAGGLKVSEPAADLAVAAALVSAASDRPVPADTVIFGEIGLSGEVRGVGQTETRLKEAAKLGFAQALIPGQRSRTARGASGGLKVAEVGHLQEMIARLGDG